MWSLCMCYYERRLTVTKLRVNGTSTIFYCCKEKKWKVFCTYIEWEKRPRWQVTCFSCDVRSSIIQHHEQQRNGFIAVRKVFSTFGVRKLSSLAVWYWDSIFLVTPIQTCCHLQNKGSNFCSYSKLITWLSWTT